MKGNLKTTDLEVQIIQGRKTREAEREKRVGGEDWETDRVCPCAEEKAIHELV